MTHNPRTIWVIGPSGSGKSTLLHKLSLPGFQLVDQDLELEQALRDDHLPLDTTRHDAAQTGRFHSIRREISQRLWAQVPEWRKLRIPLVFTTTGNKPQLLRQEVEKCQLAGYQNMGLGLRCPLDVCLARNRSRERVLAAEFVASTWHDFEESLGNRFYECLFGHEHWHVLDSTAINPISVSLAQQLTCGYISQANGRPA